MKRTVKSAVVVAAAMAMATSACSSGSSSSGGGISTDGKGKTVTVWLMSDAQKGWPDVVNQANARFEKETGAKVKVEWQEWSNYTTKLDSTFSGTTGHPRRRRAGQHPDRVLHRRRAPSRTSPRTRRASRTPTPGSRP